MQPTKSPRTGIAGYVLALALLMPLGLMAYGFAQLSGLNLSVPSTLAYADNGERVVASRPAPSNSNPPPTLAVPTATPKPTLSPATPTAVSSPTAVPTPMPRTYTVRRGDELKKIAAQYGVTIWQIIDTNDIPNPDSLRVGQVLHIPES